MRVARASSKDTLIYDCYASYTKDLRAADCVERRRKGDNLLRFGRRTTLLGLLVGTRRNGSSIKCTPYTYNMATEQNHLFRNPHWNYYYSICYSRGAFSQIAALFLTAVRGMSNSLAKAIQAIAIGNPSQVAEANAFLLAFVDSDDAWQPALDVIRLTADDFSSSFAANFLYTKIRRHWSHLNPAQRQQVFSILSLKLRDLSQIASASRIVVNRIALALFCICSRIPSGIASFASQAFQFFSSPDFKGLDPAPQLIALEMLSIMPGEVFIH